MRFMLRKPSLAGSDNLLLRGPAAPHHGAQSSLSHALIALEKRYVFDAALAGDLMSIADGSHPAPADDAGHSSLGATLLQAGTPAESTPGTVTDHTAAAAHDGGLQPLSALYIIDANVDQRDALIAGLPSDARIVILDSARDGVVQIAEAVQGFGNIGQIHVFAHGDSGELYLGASVLDTASMQSVYRATLAGIGSHLSENSDILVYGCEFAEGAKGQAAADLLSALTGADVAASSDLTGAARLGGDWDLEYQSGVVESSSLAFAAFDATLAPPVAVSETYQTNYNTPVSGNVSPNDSDPENDPLTFSIHSQPANGTVTLNSDGSFTYTPNNGFSGEDFFIYRVTDNTTSNPNFANASATIVVGAAPNSPPVANDDSYTAPQDTPINGDVCTNDTDANGDTLTHTLGT